MDFSTQLDGKLPASLIPSFQFSSSKPLNSECNQRRKLTGSLRDSKEAEKSISSWLSMTCCIVLRETWRFCKIGMKSRFSVDGFGGAVYLTNSNDQGDRTNTLYTEILTQLLRGTN
jgi:hypothetical protein